MQFERKAFFSETAKFNDNDDNGDREFQSQISIISEKYQIWDEIVIFN